MIMTKTRNTCRPRAHLVSLKCSSQVVVLMVVVASVVARVGERATATAIASASFGNNNSNGREVDSLLDQLEVMESRRSTSLAECSKWFQLNQRLEQLAGGQRRAGALSKERECDQLERSVSQSRGRLAQFKQLLVAAAPQLEAVTELVSQFLELSPSESAQLARELTSPQEIGAHNTLEQFIEIMRDTLGATSPALAGAPASAPTLPVAPFLHDDAAKLDSTLRQLVDREDSLSPDELDVLTELYGQLERLLASGRVPVHTGRFRYLSGTLEAARGVMLQGLLDEQEEENQRLQAELLARKQQAEAELAMKSHLIEHKQARNRQVGRSNVQASGATQRPLVNTAAVEASSAASRQQSGEASAMALASHRQQRLPGGRISSAASSMASAMAVAS